MLRLVVLGLAGALAASPVSAAAIVFTASLSGAQEVPPVATPATGFISAVADDVAQTLSVSETFSGLSSPSAAAHLHVGRLGVNGPIVLPFLGFPTGVVSGSYSTVFTAANLINQATSGVFTFPQLLTALETGNVYANIHSTAFPGGEIRGQLAVPEPASLAMLAVGLLGLGAAYRNRRRPGSGG